MLRENHRVVLLVPKIHPKRGEEDSIPGACDSLRLSRASETSGEIHNQGSEPNGFLEGRACFRNQHPHSPASPACTGAYAGPHGAEKLPWSSFPILKCHRFHRTFQIPASPGYEEDLATSTCIYSSSRYNGGFYWAGHFVGAKNTVPTRGALLGLLHKLGLLFYAEWQRPLVDTAPSCHSHTS